MHLLDLVSSLHKREQNDVCGFILHKVYFKPIVYNCNYI